MVVEAACRFRCTWAVAPNRLSDRKRQDRSRVWFASFVQVTAKAEVRLILLELWSADFGANETAAGNGVVMILCSRMMKVPDNGFQERAVSVSPLLFERFSKYGSASVADLSHRYWD